MGTDSRIVGRSLELCDPLSPALSLLHVKPALRKGVGEVPILAARPSVSREPARGGALQVVSCEALLGPPIPCCRPCGSVSPEGAGPLTWWTRRHAVHVLGSVHSRAGTLHVERLCGSSSRVKRIVGAASPVPHDQRLARCLREVGASSVSSERTRIPPKGVCLRRDTVRRETPREVHGPPNGTLSGRRRGRQRPDSTDQESFTENMAP